MRFSLKVFFLLCFFTFLAFLQGIEINWLRLVVFQELNIYALGTVFNMYALTFEENMQNNLRFKQVCALIICSYVETKLSRPFYAYLYKVRSPLLYPHPLFKKSKFYPLVFSWYSPRRVAVFTLLLVVLHLHMLLLPVALSIV